MREQPALGPVALAILLLGSILRSDELRHQRQHHVMAGSYDHGRQHSVIMLRFAVRSFARQALRTAQLLRTEILRAIQRHQRPSAQPLKCLQAVALLELLQNLVEAGLQRLRGNRVEHQANVVVCGDLPHSKQSMAIRSALSALQMPLMSKERLALHEEQGKRRKPNISHGVVHIRAASRIGKSPAHGPQPVQKRLKYLHDSTQHSTTLRKIAIRVPISFRTAGPLCPQLCPSLSKPTITEVNTALRFNELG